MAADVALVPKMRIRVGISDNWFGNSVDSIFCHAPGWTSEGCLVLVLFLVGAAAGVAQKEAIPVDAGDQEIARQRKEWFFQQRAYPLGFIPSGAHLKAIQELDRREQPRALGQAPAAPPLPLDAWTFIGPEPTNTPFNVPVETGRVSALAVDPRDPKVVYLGATLGGVWKTTDGGQNWAPLGDSEASLSIGSIALDPANPDIVYVGTGDLSSFYGAGILKSINGGMSWTNVPGPFVGPFGPDSFFGSSARIVSLAAHPTNSQILLASAWRWPPDQGGIFLSTDAGNTWKQVLAGPGDDVMFDPTNGNVAYAALGHYYGYAGSGVYRSTDAGLTWALDDGTGTDVLPPQSDMGTVRLALASSEPSRLYAFVYRQNTFPPVPLGHFKTLDGGAHWTRLPAAPSTCCNPLIVQPTHADVLYGGGAFMPGSVFRSLDGGQTWNNVSMNPDGTWLHADTHSFAFTSDGTKLYIGNDGGVSSTTDVRATPVTWTDLNSTLAITTFYPGISIGPVDPAFTLGGAQDSGAQRYSGLLPWFQVTCGDGGWTAIDFTTPTTVYATCQNIDIQKSILSGDFGSWVQASSGINRSDRVSFIPPFVMDPSNSQTLYFGTYRLYQTTDGASSWTAISSDLTGGSFYTLTAIAVAPSDFKTVYTGSLDGRVSVTTNADQGAGATWSNISAGLPPRAVTQIAAGPSDSRVAYVTFSGFSGFFGDTQGHVFQTTDGGATWTDISGISPNALPNIPVNDIVVDPDVPGNLYLGTDVGVFASADRGSSWTPLASGLPRVQIMALKLHRPTRTLRAASYGRGAWDLNVPLP